MALPATDNFNRADGLVGANWTFTDNFLEIISNECTGFTAGDINAGWWDADAFPDDQYAQCTLTASSHDGGPGVRCSGTTDLTNNGYFIEAFGGSDRVIKFVNGTQTNLFNVTTPYIVGDVMRIEVSGTTITAYINGSPNGNGTDSSVASGAGGLWNYSDTGRYDDWSAGAIGGASASLTGTAGASITEADIVAGGKTIILTVAGDTFIPA